MLTRSRYVRLASRHNKCYLVYLVLQRPFTLARSRSSPSPPSRPPSTRGDTFRRSSTSKPLRKRQPTVTINAPDHSPPHVEWSSSYQAGSSSSGSNHDSEDEDDTEDDDRPVHSRGRAFSNSRHATLPPLNTTSAALGSPRSGPGAQGAVPFTRSRSPGVYRTQGNTITAMRNASPVVFSMPGPSTVLPSHLQLRARLAFLPWTWTFSIDSKKAGECFLLLGSLLYACSKLAGTNMSFVNLYNVSTISELHISFVVASLYIIWSHGTIQRDDSPPPRFFLPLSLSLSAPNASRAYIPPSRVDTREHKRASNLNAPNKASFAFLWMSVPKNYRDSDDDGILTGLLFGPLIACALLCSALDQMSRDPRQVIPDDWRIEAPFTLDNVGGQYTALEALVLSRFNLVDMSTLTSSILLFHVMTSRWVEDLYLKRRQLPEGERGSVPRREGLRNWYYILFTVVVSLASLSAKYVLEKLESGIWQHMSSSEVLLGALFYQFALYVCLRLAHQVFTLGELGLVCFGGTALLMEFVNVNTARLWPLTTPFVKTYRLPTPLLIFQMALVAGSLLSGFVLSPILVLSRHIAQLPVRRLRLRPEDKLRQRRLLALGFYVGLFVIVVGLIGMWTRWCLGKRDPWLWVIFYLLDGRKKWSRPALLVYWALLGSLSVAAWSRQLARNRRFRPWTTNWEHVVVPGATANVGVGNNTPPPAQPDPVTGSGATPLPSPPILASGGSLATDLLDAADKHVPTLKLNARRKSFHALTVVMFLPGVAFDPAFTHLCFSAAFALFTFAEYVRYFAIYPFGAVVHLFMNEFLDQKDNGTAIVSHFYLLTGCAGSLWLETPSKLLQFTGVLVLGVGDALASIVGKRIGIHKWSPSTSKTLEGSLAFATSIVVSAWFLRLCGLVGAFSTTRYSVVVVVAAALEAFSDQNDNLTLPLYLWSMLVLANP